MISNGGGDDDKEDDNYDDLADSVTMIKAMITMKIIIMMIMKTIDGKMYTVVVRLPFEMKLEPLMMMQLPLL